MTLEQGTPMTDQFIQGDTFHKVDAAAWLKVSIRQLERIPRSDLPYSRPAGRRLYRRAALEAYLVKLEERMQPSPWNPRVA